MKLNRMIVIAGIAGSLCLTGSKALAQPDGAGGGGFGGGGGGFNFDPAAIQQRIMDNYREQLEVKDDAEWKLIQERVQKVTDAQRDAGSGMGGLGGMMGGMMGGMRRGGGAGGFGGGGAGGAFSAFLPAPNPAQEALQKSVDANAPAAELKAALAKYQESLKERQTKLEAARAELRKVLSVRREAIATLLGLL